MVPRGFLSPGAFDVVAMIITSILLVSLTPTTSAEDPYLEAGNRKLWCTNITPWLTPHFNNEDCREANVRFILTDYDRYKRHHYEFLDLSTPSISRYPRMRTPRRGPIGRCTGSIGMRWCFPDQPPLPSIPGQPQGPFTKSVVSSYDELYEVVQQVFIGCGGTKTPLGWLEAGKDNSLGVFYLATGSEVERNIPIGVGGGAVGDYLRNVTGGFVTGTGGPPVDSA